ncbi:MAG TPA: adenylosuccinate lyase [Chroococcales cyanobacterium]|jgi:adenylosuccinate lyase
MTLESPLSPLDGRYQEATRPLRAYFSEFALNRYRLKIEIEYFLFFSRALGEACTPEQEAKLEAIAENFSEKEAAALGEMEKLIRHDLKAVEYFLKGKIFEIFDRPELAKIVERVHFGLTSEDINNLAYSCMLRDGLREVLLPKLRELSRFLAELTGRTKDFPMLARTHGQCATPTTMGKEIGVFLYRLIDALEDLVGLKLTGKLNGATGTYGALFAAYPEIDWLEFSRSFVLSLGLDFNPLTTQIEPHDRLAALCDRLRRLNGVLLDLDQDFWRYISDGYFVQRTIEGEVGSSAMPHKVNPIHFENSEGNLGMANALLVFFSEKLTKSRLQRDLSDSTVLRNLGVAFGHCLLAYDSCLKGLSRLAVAPEVLLSDCARHPEVLAEAYQTILRAVGYPKPYEALKGMSRGKEISLAGMRDFVDSLSLEAPIKERLLALEPENYLGYAPRLAEVAVARFSEFWSGQEKNFKLS